MVDTGTRRLLPHAAVLFALALLPGVRGVFEVSSTSVSAVPGVSNLLTGPNGVTFDDSGFKSVAASLALLAAALKAPLVALYQISAEVVVMVALILFISYIASLLGIDDFRRRTGLPADDVEETDRSYFDRFVNSQPVQLLTEKVHDALENFDVADFLDSLDTRF